jgi:hypothetical protein
MAGQEIDRLSDPSAPRKNGTPQAAASQATQRVPRCSQQPSQIQNSAVPLQVPGRSPDWLLLHRPGKDVTREQQRYAPGGGFCTLASRKRSHSGPAHSNSRRLLRCRRAFTRGYRLQCSFFSPDCAGSRRRTTASGPPPVSGH